MWRNSTGDANNSIEPQLFSFNDLDDYFARGDVPMPFVDDPTLAPPAAPSTSSVNSPVTPPTVTSSVEAMRGPCAFQKQIRALGINIENGDYDIDKLCTEMREKATCQEAARLAMEQALSEGTGSLSSIFSIANGHTF